MSTQGTVPTTARLSAIGLPSFVAFELPVLTTSRERAVATLGGPVALQRVVSTLPATAVAYLRPSDPFCHGISGERKSCSSSVLLRLSPSEKSGGARTWSPSIIGLASNVYSFDGLADFQFTGSSAAPCDRFSLESAGSLSHDGPKRPGLLGFAVPPAQFVAQAPSSGAYLKRLSRLFSQQPSSATIDRRFPSSQADRISSGLMPPETAAEVNAPSVEADALANVPAAHLIQEEQLSIVNAYFNLSLLEQHVPSTPYTGFKLPQSVPAAVLVERLRASFALRPVWSLPTIAAFLATESKHVKPLLPAVAYYVRKGQFGLAWVRLGYDPRETPDSRLFMMLDVAAVNRLVQPQDGPDITGTVTAGETVTATSGISLAGVVLSNRSTFHVCDLLTLGLTQFVSDAPWQSLCADEPGTLPSGLTECDASALLSSPDPLREGEVVCIGAPGQVAVACAARVDELLACIPAEPSFQADIAGWVDAKRLQVMRRATLAAISSHMSARLSQREAPLKSAAAATAAEIPGVKRRRHDDDCTDYDLATGEGPVSHDCVGLNSADVPDPNTASAGFDGEVSL
jgi:hypothetical protein